MSEPPLTDRDPVSETIHGEPIVDPYRWLEASDEHVREWETAQNAFTDTVLSGARRDSLRPRLESLAERTAYDPPTISGGRYFQTVRAADAEQARLTVREARDGDGRTLLDPETIGEEVAVGWFVPSPEGDRVVVGLTAGGTEEYDLRVLDVEDGSVIDRIDDAGRSGSHATEWLDDGFYYLRTAPADGEGHLEKELRFRELDGTDRLVSDEIPPKCWAGVHVDRERDLVLVSITELAAETALYRLEDGDLVPVIEAPNAEIQPLVHGGRVYLWTNYEAPRFRLLRIDAGDIENDREQLPVELAAAETILEQHEDVLVDVAPAGDGIAAHWLRDAQSVVTLHDSDGTERHELALPDHVGIARGAFDGSDEDAELAFVMAGFDRPPAVVHADADESAGPEDWTVVQSPELPARFDPRDELELTVRRLWVDSIDGARVPVYLVHRSDFDPDDDEQRPTVLYGYGGFRIPQLPNFDPYRLAFLADGGVYASACLRGGLEFGEEWHEQGSGEHAHHTFEDVEAVADALVERGLTDPQHLAFVGRSNGGLTAGAVLTRRPERFGAVISGVPLLDMLRFHQFLLGRTWTAEYGSPEDPEAFEWLHEYSPYHNVAERSYPPTLLWTAAGDTRVHPAHARKMAARLQAKTTGEAPICFRSYDGAGHGLGIPTSMKVSQQLDQWSFLYEMLEIGGA